MQPEPLFTIERIGLERLKLAADVILAETDAIAAPLEAELVLFRERLERALLLPDRAAAGTAKSMTRTHDRARELRAAIERAGYYPALVTSAITAALGPQPVTEFFVYHGAIFDEGEEVRRHITVLALTPTRLVCSHIDEYPAEVADGGGTPPRAEASTETIPLARLSVAVTQVVPDPAAYDPGTTTPSEVIVSIDWNARWRAEGEQGHCGNDDCQAFHGYLSITADDLMLRVSQAADGPDAIRQALAFAAALTGSTTPA